MLSRAGSRSQSEPATESLAEALTALCAEVGIPFADKLPKPSELVAGTYDFVEQLLAAQRKFAEDVLHATAPLFYGDTAPAAKKTGTAAK